MGIAIDLWFNIINSLPIERKALPYAIRHLPSLGRSRIARSNHKKLLSRSKGGSVPASRKASYLHLLFIHRCFSAVKSSIVLISVSRCFQSHITFMSSSYNSQNKQPSLEYNTIINDCVGHAARTRML